MKSRVVLAVLAVMGTLALTATAAQAGAGGSPSPLTSFFVCHGISHGDASGAVVDVDSSFFANNPQNVRIGKGILACAFAKLLNAVTGTEIEPNPPGTHEQLKCYTFSSGAPSSAPPTLYDVTDELGGDTEVQANQLQFICGPATFTLPPE
jgi:hypothetical protein